MRRFFFLLIIFFITSNLTSEPLIEIDVNPNKSFRNISSIALFKFDSKLVNSGRVNLIDYLSISHDFYQYLIRKFSENPKITVIDTEKNTVNIDDDNIELLRSNDLPEYDGKSLSRNTITSKDTVKSVDHYLYGKINKFYEGRTFDTSYIDITVYLVDSKSKVIYWISGVRGCLKYVADALTGITATGKYTEPSVKEEFDWVNPYEVRVKNWSLQYRRGYFITMGEVGKKLENGWIHNIALNFKLPIWGNVNLVNQFEFSIMPSFQNIDSSDPLMNYTYNSFLPLMFNFIYNPDQFIRIKNVALFLKAGIGCSFNELYYSGLGKYREGEMTIDAVFNTGIGIEYILRIGRFSIFGLKFNIDQLGFLGEVDYFNWLSADPSSSGMNLSFGMKYYF